GDLDPGRQALTDRHQRAPVRLPRGQPAQHGADPPTGTPWTAGADERHPGRTGCRAARMPRLRARSITARPRRLRGGRTPAPPPRPRGGRPHAPPPPVRGGQHPAPPPPAPWGQHHGLPAPASGGPPAAATVIPRRTRPLPAATKRSIARWIAAW